MWPRHRSSHEAGWALGFRSGLEASNSKHLESLHQPVLYETFKIPYVIPESLHHYTPDFLLANGIIVETKGRWLAPDRAKMLLVRCQFPELDIRMVFSRAKSPIATGSKTTMGAWADAHGIKWAEKLIPASWVKEVGPKVKPHEVLLMKRRKAA